MIRPFHLRDLGLIHRLGDRDVGFQTQATLTTVPHPVRHALVNMLVGRNVSTYVWKSKNPEAAAYAQIILAEDQPNAHLANIGVELLGTEDGEPGVAGEDVWLPLLDQLVAVAGRQGVHNLIAEAAEDGPELPLLRRAGFVVYTRQDIWVIDGLDSEIPECELTERQPVDDWDINVLYSSVVPGMIQSVEPGPPLDSGRNWVLREDGELTAYVHVSVGPIANWMRLFIHPNARTKPRNIINAALHADPPSSEQPTYCCVRRYQSWLLGALERTGFRPWGSQAVMVKHIAQRFESPVQVADNVLEPKAVPGSTSIIQGMQSGCSRNGH